MLWPDSGTTTTGATGGGGNGEIDFPEGELSTNSQIWGFVHRQNATSGGTRPSRHGGWLASELKLTPEQQEKMEKIWSDTAFRGRHDREEKRRELIRDRDQAIANLIRPEDKPKYDQVLKTYAERTETLDNESRLAIQSAVEQTKQILTPEQRARYEQLRQHEDGERSRHDGRGRDRGEDHQRNRSHTAPASS
jgi:Spy/CpxP family protein refolding chaperone